MTPKVLLFDIETTPFIAYTWGPKYNVNLIDYVEDWHVLCFAYKWLGQDEIHVVGQDDFKRSYRRNRRDDRQVVQAMWDLFDEADVVIAHNGDKFDIRKMNARFAVHGMTRPSPFHTVDTLKVARKMFAFGSNSLNDLGKFLKLGHKLVHTGFDLWLGCMAGNKESWSIMKRYNVQDVRLLEAVYLKFRNEGWITSHPNMSTITGEHMCPTCGADTEMLMKRGIRHAKTNSYQQWHCQICNSYSRSRISEPGTVERTQ